MRSILSLVFALFTLITNAQTGGGTSNRKAQNAYEEAVVKLRTGQSEMAEIYFQKAIEADPAYLDPKFDLAYLYLKSNRAVKARPLMEAIVLANPNYSPNLILNLALFEQKDGDYRKALAYFEQYMDIAPESSSNYLAAKKGAASCEFAMWAMEHPVDFNPVNLGNNINSFENEYFPAMTADESLLIFTRETDAPNNPYSPDGRDEDFYFSEKQEDGTWGKAYNPGRPINSPWREGAPTISPDGKFIVFTICDLYGQYGEDKRGYGSCDLFVSQRNGKTWSKPVNMGTTINSKHWESQPCLASDGKTLYFVRGMYNRDRERMDDIYMSEMVNGKWSQAVPLANNINSTDDEESVFIHPDNQTLYFSSMGHAGMGNMDIFMSRRKSNGEWDDPVNLGYPINTAGHENSFFVSADGKYAIIASDREGGYGKLDLYSFPLPTHLRPQPITYLAGSITDSETQKPLEAAFKLIDLASGDTVAQAFSDKVTGRFLVVLPSSKNYALLAEHDGYLFHSENFELNLKSDQSTHHKDIALHPIAAGKSVVLRNVFFDTDKYDLRTESRTELERLARLMRENPTLKIEIGGHTDNHGSPAANKTLSENRAKAVYVFLVQSGIDSTRLTYKGYGQDQPIADNTTETGRQQNRRTTFKITER